MKIQKCFLFLSILFIAASTLSAQEIKKAIPFHRVEGNRTSISSLSLFSFALLNVTSPDHLQISTSFFSGVHYNSFFCKMEVRNLERYHIGIKFHAGDYDSYSKGYDRK